MHRLIPVHTGSTATTTNCSQHALFMALLWMSSGQVLLARFHCRRDMTDVPSDSIGDAKARLSKSP